MREPKLDMEIIDSQKAILVVQCPACGNESRFLLSEVTPGTSILCNCGAVLDLSVNSLKSIHRKLDESYEKPDSSDFF